MRLSLTIAILGAAFTGCGDTSDVGDGPAGNDLARRSDLRVSDLRAGGDQASTGGDMAMSGGDMSANAGDMAMSGGDMSANAGDMAMSGGDMSANAGDMAMSGGDLAGARDMATTGGDMATRNDLSTTPDQAMPRDLAGADLSGTCTTACDCQAGQACFNGRCTAAGQPIYCCSSANCPARAICQNSGGSFGQCPVVTDGGVDMASNRDMSGAFCSALDCSNGGVNFCMMFGCGRCVPDTQGNTLICAP
jgi:filamentous hemagglutinin